ncbi:5-methyltetrahydropteroyltriglutamate--homocysteine S-methyltransferase [Paeniglutamicibacter gangotriensis]|uniref:5-methyltetrahydropteroyltriglutamate--homocysteine S-methyltransferase n=2 Tax=Paeniglutamicibacter gangotriensis TaxID=254787 RepID=M7MSW2_9MICC|nr:5-methyltetrahydropteroyltriglutamate--homocysteine S-methyltransferase [Paeniglutamicibacter gangotriensis]EMQ99507.1 5-methyltetrahydropteroyltriglutamate-- homocysteine S-methyltransferase [Paeniglutamicibacter gangotriensis Lz1y]KAA0978858.1 5-methyltetrahydropteroyltriglutamate--homocysteine S-methyltransferase [Paeniglutamicibacter gangotriensis]
MSKPTFPAASILGYPRIGPNRELKKALESHWAARTDEATLHAAARELQNANLAKLTGLGLGADDASLPGDFAYYDQVLDATVALSALPARFADLADAAGAIDTAASFVLARGDESRAPLEMTKWFDTNYHYLVPEIGEATPLKANAAALVESFTAHAANGNTIRPTLVGPISYLLLAKAEDGAPAGFDPLVRIDEVVAAYGEILAALAAAGAPWVQLDEPALVTDRGAALAVAGELAETVYSKLAAATTRPALLVTLGYGTAGDVARPGATQGLLARAGVEAVHVDLVRGAVPAAEFLGELAGSTLVAGIVDSRNIWRNDLAASLGILTALRTEVEKVGGTLAVGTATSLQHVPHDVALESDLPAHLPAWLAFANQKVAEVITLATGLAAGESAIAAQLSAAETAIVHRAGFAGTTVAAVRERLSNLTTADFSRSEAPARKAAQELALALPPLPTTTIGSFPQTTEVRTARAAHRAGTLDDAAYDGFLKDEIARVVELQERLGLDVLVHGEAERNDMVQYFAENFDGFSETENGWVQSYGSRATRPSILWGDVSRPAAFTVPWITHAASLTTKPLKGMLTGPVTILAWSFIRDDQPLSISANQVALALRDEIADLQDAGIGIIQVDEPALRELLPLRATEQAKYLGWSVDSFRLATSGAADATQIHTHLCYSEFGEIIEAIDALDADVTSIEAARSRMEVTADLTRFGYGRGIGPGVYDIHSPRVPSTEEVAELIDIALGSLDPKALWINPDCGLKTRGYAETEASLANLVSAAVAARATLGVAV